MNKTQAAEAINNGAKMYFLSAALGCKPSAEINGQSVRIDTARKLKEKMVMVSRSCGVSVWIKA